MNRNNASQRILIAGGLFLVLGLVGYALPTQRPDVPVRSYFDSAGGPVLFPHDRHEELSPDCAQCHHETLGEELRVSCVGCHHVEAFDVVEWEDEDMLEIHAELAEAGEEASGCLGCHEHAELIPAVRAASTTGCADCHEADEPALVSGHNCAACHAAAEDRPAMACGHCHRDGEGETPTCATCHDDEEYTPDMADHVDLVELEEHTCTGCHVASRAADALHGRCNRCHADVEHGTFFARSKENADTVCKTCHLNQ